MDLTSSQLYISVYQDDEAKNPLRLDVILTCGITQESFAVNEIEHQSRPYRKLSLLMYGWIIEKLHQLENLKTTNTTKNKKAISRCLDDFKKNFRMIQYYGKQRWETTGGVNREINRETIQPIIRDNYPITLTDISEIFLREPWVFPRLSNHPRFHEKITGWFPMRLDGIEETEKNLSVFEDIFTEWMGQVRSYFPEFCEYHNNWWLIVAYQLFLDYANELWGSPICNTLFRRQLTGWIHGRFDGMINEIVIREWEQKTQKGQVA